MEDKRYAWSNFIIRIPKPNGSVLLKSTLSGAAVLVEVTAEEHINTWLNKQPPQSQKKSRPYRRLT